MKNTITTALVCGVIGFVIADVIQTERCNKLLKERDELMKEYKAECKKRIELIRKRAGMDAYLDGFENGARAMKKHQIGKDLFD